MEAEEEGTQLVELAGVLKQADIQRRRMSLFYYKNVCLAYSCHRFNVCTELSPSIREGDLLCWF